MLPRVMHAPSARTENRNNPKPWPLENSMLMAGVCMTVTLGLKPFCTICLLPSKYIFFNQTFLIQYSEVEL